MRFRLPTPRLRRGLVAVVALLGQVAATFGMPLPSAAPRKDTTRPFPCMSHSCGCMNLDEFWHSCCCYTNAEKLAWAEANGVFAPDFVREAAMRETKKPSCPHCSARKNEKPASIKWAFGFAARRCGGHGPIGAAQHSPAVPARMPEAMNFDFVCVGMLGFVERQAEPLPTDPRDPPPRV